MPHDVVDSCNLARHTKEIIANDMVKFFNKTKNRKKTTQIKILSQMCDCADEYYLPFILQTWLRKYSSFGAHDFDYPISIFNPINFIDSGIQKCM